MLSCLATDALNAVFEPLEIAHGTDSSGCMLAEQSRGHGFTALGKNGKIIGVDGQVVDGANGGEVSLVPGRLILLVHAYALGSAPTEEIVDMF